MSEELKDFTQDLLRDDPSGQGRARLQEELVRMQAGLKRTLDAGVAPAEAALLGALGQSVEAARTAVDRMWERFNN
ncbi:hypothetical protein [Desulfocurvus sp.]|jgi:hypothetical protein|uniref:hypothetical protein n=1 Tax=Desulfocurvus sp. TaxID=2871698 RepID=UPI0025C2B6D9|nr:hypothetical protein [Desulfocurvus sp.]MCK9239993.1 hypothetical protein [Desulfocurvus sp.]